MSEDAEIKDGDCVDIENEESNFDEEGSKKENKETCPMANSKRIFKIKALKLENEDKERKEKGILPKPEEKTLAVHEKTYIHPVKLREYCSSLFEISDEIVSFERKNSEDYVNPKLITQDLPEIENPGVVKYKVNGYKYEHGSKEPCIKEGTLNLYGKTWTCLLHEFAQKVYFAIPEYVGEEKDQSYSYFVRLDGKEYGIASGPSKKIAKAESELLARVALFSLIPDLDLKPDISKIVDSKKSVAKMPTEQDLEFFNTISIEDIRIAELSTKLALPTPNNLLKVCFNRMCIPDSYLKVNHQTHGNRHSIEMTFNGETVKAISRNKKDGMNMCSQKILRILHPQIKFWGELLNLYGPKANESSSKTETQENDSKTLKADTPEVVDNNCQRKLGSVDEAKKSKLINILRSKMLELSDKWNTLDIVKRKAKFFEKPETLPYIDYHVDASKSIYSSVPQPIHIQNKSTKRPHSNNNNKRHSKASSQHNQSWSNVETEAERQAKIPRIAEKTHSLSCEMPSSDDKIEVGPIINLPVCEEEEEPPVTKVKSEKSRNELLSNKPEPVHVPIMREATDDDWDSMKDFMSTDNSDGEEGEIID